MILNCPVEGNSVRGTARLCDVEKRTVLNILTLAGETCERLFTERVRWRAGSGSGAGRNLDLCRKASETDRAQRVQRIDRQRLHRSSALNAPAAS